HTMTSERSPLLFPRAVNTTRTVLDEKDKDVDKSAAETEQAQRVVLDTAQFFIVKHDTANTTALGQDTGTRPAQPCGDNPLDRCRRLDLLGGEHPCDRGQGGVAVEQLQVAGQLLDPVDVAAPLELHCDSGVVVVTAQDVHGADRRGVLATDEGVPLAERGDVL